MLPKLSRSWRLFGAATLIVTSLLIAAYQFNVLSSMDTALRQFRVVEFNNFVEKRAYASFLSTDTTQGEVDHYYTAMRTMVYKLLHDPETKTRIGTEFVVMVNGNVEQVKIDQMEKDGAVVRHVDDIKQNWTKPGTERWVDQFTKLRLWELTEWDRMLYIDADMIILRSLDGIWLDNSTFPQKTSKVLDELDEAAAPTHYVMAGIDDTGDDHRTPPIPANDFNGGFFVMKPSREMFDKYVSILNIPERFDSSRMEQNLLNYAHREDGPMPWMRLKPGAWNTNHPNMDDWNYGTATLHNKLWPSSGEAPVEMRFRYVDDVKKMREHWGEKFEYQDAYDKYVKEMAEEEAVSETPTEEASTTK
jgi:alpha-N-acetylglucosamine transferase